MKSEEQLRLTERLLVEALVEKERLEKILLGRYNDTIERVSSMEAKANSADALQEALTGATRELVALRGVVNLPGDVEIVQRVSDGKGGTVERPARPEELAHLCEANGLVVLPKGQFICGGCGAPRTVDECKWCPLVGDKNSGGNHEETTATGVGAVHNSSV